MVEGFAAAFPAVAHIVLEGTDLPDAMRVDGDDGHHLVRVRRLRVGEEVTVADGVGGWRPYRVAGVADGGLDLGATDVAMHEPESTPGLAVAFALTKGVGPETVVRQLTELGVDVLMPVVAERSIARPRSERVEAVLRRLRRVAREAAMQCRRARLPRVEAPGPLAGLGGRPGLVVADREGDPAAGLEDPGPTGWLLVVGPEGGFGPEDLAVLGAAPRLAVGAHVLRADTAAVAAAALLVARRSSRPLALERARTRDPRPPGPEAPE